MMTENTTNEPARFDGCVHEGVNADIGTNRDGERVVRLDLHYIRGTAPTTSTMILGLEAAIALRNFLDGLFDAAGVEETGTRIDGPDACLPTGMACPRCGERNPDSLVWQDDTTVHCMNCGTNYEPGTGRGE
jgi:hypothetical protein